MAGLIWPPNVANPMEFRISPREVVVGDASPYTGSREILHRWHQWHVYMQWNHTDYEDYQRLDAHFNRSRGGVRTFEIPIFSYRAKVGTKSGVPTLSGAHAAGVTSLTITGGSGAFAAGDWIFINHGTNVPRAYKVTTDESAGVIQINPGLRDARAGGTNVRSFADGVKDLMELAGDPDMAMSMPSPLPGYFQPFAVELVSALRRVP